MNLVRYPRRGKAAQNLAELLLGCDLGALRHTITISQLREDVNHVSFRQLRGPADDLRVWFADDLVVLAGVVELLQDVPHRLKAGALLVVALDDGPLGVLG